jgi:ankyrin repeat protein
MVRALLNEGAKVNVRRIDGATPLMIAANNGHSDVVQALLEKGADVTAHLGSGVTVLMVTKDDTVRAMLVQAGARR